MQELKAGDWVRDILTDEVHRIENNRISRVYSLRINACTTFTKEEREVVEHKNPRFIKCDPPKKKVKKTIEGWVNIYREEKTSDSKNLWRTKEICKSVSPSSDSIVVKLTGEYEIEVEGGMMGSSLDAMIKYFEGMEFDVCCSGRDCGCMGKPADPEYYILQDLYKLREQLIKKDAIISELKRAVEFYKWATIGDLEENDMVQLREKPNIWANGKLAREVQAKVEELEKGEG